MRRLMIAAAVLAALGACERRQESGLVAYGTVEATEVRVASLVGGRLLEVGPHEGEPVRKGDVVAKTDTTDLALQLAQAEAQLRLARAQEKLVLRGALPEDLTSAEKAVEIAGEQIAAIQRDLARLETLAKEGAATQKQVDDARSGLDQARKRHEQASAMLAKLRKGARAEEIGAARAQRETVEATLPILRQKLSYGEVRAPVTGRVIYRLAEPGEVVGPGAPLLVLADTAHPYVDVYVAEGRVGLARPKAPVKVQVDAWPGRDFAAHVKWVADEAEFTPKNVQTADQRSRLVFRVRLAVEDPEEQLRPGMPAQATFPESAEAPGGARDAPPQGTSQGAP